MAPETNRERLARRAAEIRAGQADALVAAAADQITDRLAAHEAKLAGLDHLMRETVAAAGLAPPESGRPRLRLIKGEAS